MSQLPAKVETDSVTYPIKYASGTLLLAFLNLMLDLNALLAYSLVKFSN